MKLRHLMFAAGMAYLILGGTFALEFQWMLPLFGITHRFTLVFENDNERFLATLRVFMQLFGVALMGIGLLALSLRGTTGPAAQRAVVNGFLMLNAMAALMTG